MRAEKMPDSFDARVLSCSLRAFEDEGGERLFLRFLDDVGEVSDEPAVLLVVAVADIRVSVFKEGVKRPLSVIGDGFAVGPRLDGEVAP